MATKFLNPETFKTVVANTPLVAIDIVLICEGRMVVGRRVNRPAAGTYFTPGGRIFKGEKFDDAFRRISVSETGFTLDRSCCNFLGIFDHIYKDSYLDDHSGTHYVCLAFSVSVDRNDLDLDCMRQQHDDIRFVALGVAVDDDTVHENTRVYASLLSRDADG